MTTIAVNESFFRTLPTEFQDALQKATLAAARFERQWSVEDAEKFEAQCADKGVAIVTLSDEDQETLRKQAMTVYDKWNDYFSPGLIDRITRH